MQFEWDDNKNKQNIQKHKLSFEEAARVFLDPNLLICPDPDTCEERWNAIGFVEKVLFVVYTEREGDVIRLISARKAMAIKNMTLDEVKNLPKLSKERIEELNTFEDTDFSDSPKKNAQQISNMKPARLVHPEWYKVKKKDIHIKIDVDVLEALKAKGKGYQTRINEILRQAVLN